MAVKPIYIELDRARCAVTMGFPVNPVIAHISPEGIPHIFDLDSLQKHWLNRPTCPLCETRIAYPVAVNTAVQKQLDRVVQMLYPDSTGTERQEYDEYLTARRALVVNPAPPSPLQSDTVYCGARCSNYTSMDALAHRMWLHFEIVREVVKAEEEIRRLSSRDLIAKTAICAIAIQVILSMYVDEVPLLPSVAASILSAICICWDSSSEPPLPYPEAQLPQQIERRLLMLDDGGVSTETLALHVPRGGKHLRQVLFFPTS